MNNRQGSSFIVWTVTFSIVLATFLYVKIYWPRPIEDKVRAVTDYMFWLKWSNSTDQYKGDDNYNSRSISRQRQSTRRAEARKRIKTVAQYQDNTTSSAAYVSDGSEDLLKSIDLNQTLE